MPSTEPPFTVDRLAARWGCSPGAIRNKIKAGKLRTFRIGTLVRIPAIEVERAEEYEWNTASSDSGEASQSYGSTMPVVVAGKGLPRPIGLERRRRPAKAGG